MKGLAKQIDKQLKKSSKVVMVIHQNPDADALGSAAAMADYLGMLKIEPVIFCATPVPPQLQFLPYASKITSDKKIFLKNIDTIMVLDCGDLRYAGLTDILPNHSAFTINIDHHPTNEKYAHINLVMPEAASTTEILYSFFKHNNARISRSMATSLMAGLVNDTDNFSNPATSESSLAVAGELLRAGANLNLIHNWIIRNKTINILKLWGLVLQRLNKKDDVDMAYTYLTKKDILQYGIEDSETEGISNFLNKLDGAKISLLIKETMDGKIKGSFRTTRDDTDVSLFAKKMGGGGHKKAAGFTTEGTIEDVLKKIMDIQKNDKMI